MAVKILLDPSMYHPHLSVADECRKAADLGYSYLELSPRADFHEWHHYPKVDRALLAETKAGMSDSGVKIWSFNPVYNWSSPDPLMREHAVRCLRRLLQIANELEVPLIATEFSGDPNRPLESEAAFYRSMEELVPDFERYGIECTIEAHPYDFVEENSRAVQIVRGVDKDWLNYEFCCPHAFHLGQGDRDVHAMMAYAGPRLRHVHIADVFDHTANVGNRYIVNPPGVDARIHQHNEIGNGEIPWDDVFGYLRETDYDGPVSVCVFGWEEDADAIHVRMRERIEAELGA
ncbi:sugar phosphate isomerase/epimerase family protein [Mobilicoccus pelagius]|uniref:Inositol catabolism protein IolH n=1 Tax=Mobilicoccus pelagius NBRC 104925 TaxID=1089455 RepID=H5USW3_9MICO|nr:sugar phosphate isomerase/epimerase family protein [Mobilicoccus pelagius]GAB48821.1 inositol catabolism protein IolH [Mobilicoccus pelagius NBRC 104925]